MDLIEKTFQRDGSLYIACNDRHAFFTSDAIRNNIWSCQKVSEALTFLSENIYMRFGSKLYRQIVGIPEFYGDLVHKFRIIIGKYDFPYHFKKMIVRYKKIGYNIDVLRQTACLVVNPIKGKQLCLPL